MNYKDFPFYQQTTLELIFNNTVEIYRKFFGWLFFYSFLFLLLMNAVASYVFSDKFQDLQQLAENPQQIGIFLKAFSLYFFYSWLGYSLYYLFIHYFILSKYLDPEKSQGIIWGETFTKYYLKYLIVIFLVFTMIMLGTMAGMLALIIGSLIASVFLGVSLFPVTPILIVENTGIWETIKRSFILVLKDFWQILGFLIIFFLIYVLFSLILGALSMAPYAGGFFYNLLHSNPEETAQVVSGLQLLNQPLYILLNSFLSAFITPLIPIFSILVYFHLKYKEDEESIIVEG